ncbi:hypothetical protein OAF30_00455 [Flavobacteriales bacterium]|nr:hypothetical protein [Flavobacteriales bacterium]
MLKLAKRIFIWITPGTIACYALWLGLLHANPGRDSLGLYRMMPTTCNAMIFGTSRSAQGVNPTILEQSGPKSRKWLNFSFNLGASPWNDAYVDAIQQKIDCSIEPESQSTFLVFVDPWVLDENTGRGEGSWLSANWSDFCEMAPFRYGLNKSNPLDVMSFGSGSDLLSVMCSSIPRQFIAFIKGNQSDYENRGLQKNGWLPNPSEITREQKIRAIRTKVKNYRNNKIIGDQWPANQNLSALERFIEYLQKKLKDPTIFIIRPPTSDEMRGLEDEWFPGANQEFARLATSMNLSFIDTHHEWKQRDLMHFNDGHHMSIDGANAFSSYIATEILQNTLTD